MRHYSLNVTVMAMTPQVIDATNSSAVLQLLTDLLAVKAAPVDVWSQVDPGGYKICISDRRVK